MHTILDSRPRVNTDLIRDCVAAIREGRAEWVTSKPIDAVIAVYYGEACWLADRPRPRVAPPADFLILVDDEYVEPLSPLAEWHNPADGPAPWELALACEAVLGPIAGPCCVPEEGEPCHACAAPDSDETAWGPSFARQLADIVDGFADIPEPIYSWLVGVLTPHADLARFLGARTVEEYEDRADCLTPAQRRDATARVPWATTAAMMGWTR